MIDIIIEGDLKNLEKHLRRTEKVYISQAAASAMNAAINKAKTISVRTVARGTGFKQKDIKPLYKVHRATWTRLSAMIRVPPFAPNLMRYNAHQTKKGVKASPMGKSRLFPGTFIANAGRTVFVRTSKQRLPIKPVYGPSLPREFLRRHVQQAMDKVAAETWQSRLTHEVNRRVRKRT